MSTYKRLPRGKSKSSDEFKDSTMHVFEWLKNNWQTSVEVLAVVLVAVAVIAGASVYWSKRSEGAAEKLYLALNAQAGSDDQVNQLTQIMDGYSRTPSGQQAMLKLGDIYLDKGDFDKATQVFKKLTGRSRNRALFMIAALHKLASAELKEGKFVEAAETYLKAASDPHNLISIDSRFRAAAAYEQANDFEKAQGLYRQIIKEAADSDEFIRDLSEERLLWLALNKRI